MKRRLLVLTLLLMGQGMVWADEYGPPPSCPPGTFLRPVGTVASTASADTAMTTSGQSVRASRVACGGTACRATLYDYDSVNDGGTNVDANVVEEPGSPANESRWQNYDPPLRFTTGVTAHLDANVVGVLAYNCR